MRKIRSDSRLDALPDALQGRLAGWLESGMSLETARAMASRTVKDGGCGVLASRAALSRWYHRISVRRLLERRAAALETRDEVARAMGDRPALWDRATVEMLQQLAFEMSLNRGVDPRDVKAIFSLVLKARSQDIEERKVQILEQKASQADAAEKLARNTKLTPAERESRIREIFGIAPTR